jgi:hypothetical protein
LDFDWGFGFLDLTFWLLFAVWILRFPESCSIMAEPNQLSNPPARAKSPLRYAVPLILFVLIIGGLAWLLQNMPAWRARPPVAAPQKGPEVVVQFTHQVGENFIMAMWEVPSEKMLKQKGDKETKPPPVYEREMEPGSEGRYLFPFQNVTQQAAELGMAAKSCDCANLHVAVISKDEWQQLNEAVRKDPGQDMAENPSWTWQALENSQDRGVILPADAVAVLRMTWHNRRPVGDKLNLHVNLWGKQAGATKLQRLTLGVPAVSAAAVRANLDRVSVGVLGPDSVAKAVFLVWSPTRAQLPLTFEEQTRDGLFAIDPQPLDKAACLALQDKLRDQEMNTRVLAGYRVTVTVHEHKGDRWLDQGHFLRAIAVHLPDAAEEISPLLVTGVVQGPVKIGGLDDQGKINLKSFQAREGTRKVIFLWTNHKTKLVLQDKQPAALQVKLNKSGKETTPEQKWVLEVTVPPNQLFGPVTEENAVILRSETQAAPPRQIRIPLLGHAVQG